MATQAAASLEAGAVAEAHPEPNYIAVFIYLAVLTAAELAVYAMNFPTVFKIGLLVALAMAKATLVAMYFMHLATERRGLWVIACIPLVLVGFCYLMLRPDLSARAWAHHPEHQSIGVREGEASAAPAAAAVDSGAPADSSAPAAAAPNQ
jgi:cytochrome c oxidase subunit IV